MSRGRRESSFQLFYSLPGRKIDALRENGKVCLQIERVESGNRWQSAIVIREFQKVKRTSKKIEILREFNKRFKHLTPVEAMLEEKWNVGGLIVFRVIVDRLNGRSETWSNRRKIKFCGCSKCSLKPLSRRCKLPAKIRKRSNNFMYLLQAESKQPNGRKLPENLKSFTHRKTHRKAEELPICEFA